MTGRHDRAPLGAHREGDGVHFTVFSSRAERVELCLFDPNHRETERITMRRGLGDAWHHYVPDCEDGQRYGYRAYGAWAPLDGLRFNSAKLLLDPYTRSLDGPIQWSSDLYDYLPGAPGWVINPADSAACMPKSMVARESRVIAGQGPGIPWPDTIIYEANVRGYTMAHPELTEAERGRLQGMSNGAILGHLKSLGITSIELMPVHTLLDEAFLHQRGRRNLFGYNSIQFFTPDVRFANWDATTEFIEMVNAIHDAGLEVLLDVVYNHTAEGDARGPSLCFRGLDNLAYYRTELADPGVYANDSGCGNTINADHRRVQDLVLDSLVYWHREMGVDGFRFDLASILGRDQRGFEADHPLLRRIVSNPGLAGAKLIAEPWDPGPGGYQLGRFPAPFAELNDRFRDTARGFWRGENGQLAELAKRLHGSADLFEADGRPPAASINFVTNHDGFTLADLAEDGSRRQRLNLLATLLFAQGSPLLLAGDEFGNSQDGNQNAYDQDNPIGWVDWRGLDEDPGFTDQVRELIALRRRLPLLRRAEYVHETGEIDWLRPGGSRKQANDWHELRAKMLLLGETGSSSASLAILVNGEEDLTEFRPPDGEWLLAFSSAGAPPGAVNGPVMLPAFSLALLEAPA